MIKSLDPSRRLSLLLWLIALHSIGVGFGLILMPSDLMVRYFGFAPITEHFFPTQAGVFHFVMAMAYGLAALDPDRHHVMVTFTILAKASALVFLIVYYALVAQAWTVLLSGITDGLFGLLVWMADRSRRSHAPATVVG